MSDNLADWFCGRYLLGWNGYVPYRDFEWPVPQL